MFSWPSFLAVLGASLAALSLGLDVGMISSTLVQPTFLSYFNNPSASAIGGIVAAFAAGGTIGAFGCALVADRYGRVTSLWTASIVVLLGCALQAGAVNVPMLIIGRLINGLGAGQLTATFPEYASEVAPPNIRGALGGLQMLMIEVAIFIATGAGYGFGVNFTGHIQWRGPLAVQAIPVILLIPLAFFLPETPRYLISKGQTEKGLQVLRRLHQASVGEEFVLGEFKEIEDQLRAERETYEPTWAEIARKPSWRKRVLLAVGLQGFLQLSGVNCIQYYAVQIYQTLGFSTQRALMLNLLYGAMGLLFGLFWVVMIDKLGRRALMIGGSLWCAAALLVQSVLSAVYNGRAVIPTNALNAQVAMFFVFNFFLVGYGMICWLLPPEILPMAIRAKGNSISVSVNYLAGLVVAQIAPIGLAHVQFKFFYLFIAGDIVGAAFYYFMMPETTRMTLEQIDQFFGDQIVPHALAEKDDLRVDSGKAASSSDMNSV